MPIHAWEDIQDQFTHALLIGNGASISIDNNFRYKSIYEAAIKNGSLRKKEHKIFTSLKTSDFEHVLHALTTSIEMINCTTSHTRTIKKMRMIYQNTKTSLITTIRSIHATAKENYNIHRDNIISFFSRFDTIFSLNYDIIPYWAIMDAQNEQGCRAPFKDCFIHGIFNQKWDHLREPLTNCDKSTLIFYPHGQLSLITNRDGTEEKVSSASNEPLLTTVAKKINNPGVRPLFVSEGSSHQKLLAISRSAYLSNVYNIALREPKPSLTIFGWSISENDNHIMDAIAFSGVQRIAISVHNGTEEAMAASRANLEAKVRAAYQRNNIRSVPDLHFYDSASRGCWITPA